MTWSSQSKNWPGYCGSKGGWRTGIDRNVGPGVRDTCTPAQFEDRKLGLLETPVACESSLTLSSGGPEEN